MTRRVVVFDAYGTLFDVAGAARLAAEEPGQTQLAALWPALAADWRAKQLEYSWLRAVTGDHVSFWQVTQDGLDWALERQGLEDAALRERLLALYWELPAYAEVPTVLADLKAAGHQTGILSNGSPDMLQGAVDSALLRELLDDVLSVEDVQIFKPSPMVYDLVGARFDCAVEDVFFVSSNGWDAAAASGYGFETAWVNRSKMPMDRLMATPSHIVQDLTVIPELV